MGSLNFARFASILLTLWKIVHLSGLCPLLLFTLTFLSISTHRAQFKGSLDRLVVREGDERDLGESQVRGFLRVSVVKHVDNQGLEHIRNSAILQRHFILTYFLHI